MNKKKIQNTGKCVGIIMDGNRRWAKKNGLPVYEGHKAGYKKLKNFVLWSKEQGAHTTIAYGFSTENWKRTKKEVGLLLGLFSYVLRYEIKNLKKEKIRLKIIGKIEQFPKKLQEEIKKAEEETKKIKEHTLVLALSYGGREEIVSAIKKIVVEKSKKQLQKLNEKIFSQYLWTKEIPYPDLIIRAGGEQRLSNFLLWQCAYSELYFTKTLWPAFSKKEFIEILNDFTNRERRFGE